MTLGDYYNELPKMTAPKTSFLEEVCARCDVKAITVRHWIQGKSVPADPKHREFLSNLTGIPEEELFPTLADSKGQERQ